MSSYRASVFSVLILIAACSGGGGGDGASPSAGASVSPALSFPLATSAQSIAAPAANVLAVSVQAGTSGYGYVNLPYASITVCSPGSRSNCQTLDNIIVDTGSTGLRIIASALSPALYLPQKTDAANNPVGECTQFAGGFSWGPLKIADVKLAGEEANALAIQVIADPDFDSVPANCAATGTPLNSVHSLRANGVLGVSALKQDCGVACSQSASPGIYYVCPASGCRAVAMLLAEQVPNPVTRFAVNNNGVILELPSIPAYGAASANGVLVFGIGTQANNGLGSASVLTLNPSTGDLTTIYQGKATRALIDSGTNALYFQEASIPTCTSGRAWGCYCPDTSRNFSATIQGTNGTTAAVNFSVANAEQLLAANPDFSAFDNLASSRASARGFTWGLPFFFGRNVFFAIEGANTPGGSGPYVAF